LRLKLGRGFKLALRECRSLRKQKQTQEEYTQKIKRLVPATSVAQAAKFSAKQG
jgi:predicted GTPase